MVHELCLQYFPDAKEVIARKKAVITKADALIAISENTREDIIKVFPEKASSITVVYHGYTFPVVDDIEIDLPEKYILFVGERWHYKNFAVFAEAVSDILKKDKSFNLICAGGKSFTESEMALLNKLDIAQQSRQIDASDEVLKQLYKRAQVFVFPSKHEGFGLPLLEAFANYCPVACSHTSSLPEIAGDAVQYFDPDDATSIRNAVETVLFNPNLQEQLKQLGALRLQQFTFDQCLHGTLAVYQSLL
jgi:glycosyltransferase involved in cell wall biosynthesis